MKQSNHFQDKNKCSEHNENAVFIKTSFSNNKNLKLCYKCILNQNKNLMLIEDVEQQFQNSKIQIIKEIKSRRERNSTILKNLKENLLKFQTSSQEKIKSILLNIDENLKQISYTNYETLDNLDIFNVDEIEKPILSNSFDFEKMKNMLINKLQTLSSSWFIKLSEQLLAKIELEEENYKLRLNQELFNCKIQNAIKMPNNNLLCDKHQCQLMMVDISEQSNVPNRIACYFCIPEYEAKYTSFEQFQQLWINNKSLLQEQFFTIQKQVNSQIENAIELINTYKEKFIKFLDVHYTALIQIKNIPNQEQVYNVQQLITKEWIDLTKQEMIEIAQTLSQINKGQIISKEIKQEFDQKLWKFKESSNHLISQFQLMQNQFIIDIQNLQKTQEEQIKYDLYQNTIINSNNKPILYEIIEQDSMLDQNITSILFSPDSSILIVGCSDGNIKVFDFKSEKLKLIEVYHEHKSQVDFLLFMKKSKEFLSGSKDETIINWSGSKKYKEWIANQKLRGNNGMLNCMTLNNDENLLAAGCGRSLKLWSKEKDWKAQQTIFEDKTDIISICFSNPQNILVTSSYNSKCISVFQLSKMNIWARSQIITTNQWGSNLIFLNNASFIFQPFNQDIIELYDFHQQNQQYEKSKEIKIYFGNLINTQSSIQIIKSQDFLLYKAGCNLNIIRCQKNGQFITELSLKLKDGKSFCTISDNSRYFATWNQDTKEFFIRKHKE